MVTSFDVYCFRQLFALSWKGLHFVTTEMKYLLVQSAHSSFHWSKQETKSMKGTYQLVLAHCSSQNLLLFAKSFFHSLAHYWNWILAHSTSKHIKQSLKIQREKWKKCQFFFNSKTIANSNSDSNFFLDKEMHHVIDIQRNLKEFVKNN